MPGPQIRGHLWPDVQPGQGPLSLRVRAAGSSAGQVLRDLIMEWAARWALWRVSSLEAQDSLQATHAWMALATSVNTSRLGLCSGP